jgi:hypothetical protein
VGFLALVPRGIFVLILALCAQRSLLAQSTLVSVPFVGCRTDTQTEPLEPPMGGPVPVPIDAKAALQLAYYKSATGLGVLGPRGWDCLGIWGSSGDSLYVAPTPMSRPMDKWSGFAEPIVLVDRSLGYTSGRFEVAQVMARVFPGYKAFVKSVREMFDFPPSEFPSSPYPKDKLTYKSSRMVEYETPARLDGLGTQSWIKKNDSPIDGVAMLIGETPDLVLLSVRPPSGLTGLTPAIVRRLERDAPGFNQ